MLGISYQTNQLPQKNQDLELIGLEARKLQGAQINQHEMSGYGAIATEKKRAGRDHFFLEIDLATSSSTIVKRDEAQAVGIVHFNCILQMQCDKHNH